MTFSPRSRRNRTPNPETAKAERRTIVALKLVEAREAAVIACDQFASRLEVRGGRLSKNDTRTWQLLIDAVKEIDAGLDLVLPRVPDPAVHGLARTRSKPPSPPFARQPL